MKTSAILNQKAADIDEIAKQFDVELTLLINTESTLRTVLEWKTGDHGIARKLSTLRYVSQCYDRHLNRVHTLAEHGGYLHLVTDSKPSLAHEVSELRGMRDTLQSDLARMIIALEHLAPNNTPEFNRICTELEVNLEALSAHGKRERDLFLRSVHDEDGVTS